MIHGGVHLFHSLLLFLFAAVVIAPLAGQEVHSDITSRSILFQTGFESFTWWLDWDVWWAPGNVTGLADDPRRAFEPLEGRALRVRIRENSHIGTSLFYRLDRNLGFEPDELYLNYCLRLADDWIVRSGGKLPGFSGTYGTAGWGGRPAQGDDGWSARGYFGSSRDGITPLGFYVYHMDMDGSYGSVWLWDLGGFHGIERNRWYCIQLYVRLNGPGRSNGILRAWVDDDLVFEKLDIRFRNTTSLRVEAVWMDIYHGGSRRAVADSHLYLDNVVVSTPSSTLMEDSVQ